MNKPEPKSQFIHRLHAGYGDTDQSGVVHHAVYLRWLEDARASFLRDKSFDYGALEQDHRVGVAVINANMTFKRPARFENLVEVELWVSKMTAVTLVFDYRLWHEDTLLLEAQITLATIDLDKMRATRIPKMLREVCAPIEIT